MHLKRQFGLWTAIALIIGQVIGVGIFLIPAAMAKSVGSPFWLFLIWIILGAMTLIGALCFGELASRFPEAGGSYVYLREAYGRPLAFLYGWMVLLVLDPGLTAIFGVGLASYAAYLIELSPAGKQILAVSIVVVVGLINILGARLGAGFLKALTVLKIGTLIFIVLYGFLGNFGSWANFSPFFAQPADMFGAMAGGVGGAFFAFAGWWEVTRIAGEIENPQKNVPRALAFGVIGITIIYILTSAVFLYLVPVARVTSDETFAAQAGEALFGKTGGAVFAAIVVVSVLGTLVAYLMVAPRVYYAMAKDGLFFKSFGEPHRRFKTPHRAILIQIVLGSILILSGTFEQILSYFFFIVVVFLALTVAGLFIIRKQEFDGYKTILFPFTPLFFLLITAVVLALIAMRNPLQTILGIGVVLLGIPVYYLIFSKNLKSKI
ncbi:MAG TPA: amino acid permease [Pyrinomonadaceae bacterium]|jgi:APA family basic amino acid/polyamine antiporter